MSVSSRMALIAALTVLVFVTDFQLPLGVAAEISYICPVLLTLGFYRSRATVLVAATATLLTLGTYLLSMEQVPELHHATTNLLLSLGAIWITAALVIQYLRADEARRSSDATARERWEQLEQIYRTAPVGLCLFDSELRYRFINERLATINGLPVEDHIGKKLEEVVPALAGQVVPVCRQVLETGEPVLGSEVTGRTPADESDRFWIVSYYPVKSGGQQVRGINTVVQDITERKRVEDALRESEATARTYLESASQAVLGVTEGGKIVLANEMAEDIFGYMRDELKGQAVERLLPHHLRGAHVSHRASYFAEPRRRPMGAGLELAAQKRDGSTFPVEVSLSHIETPSGRIALAFVSDISERVRARDHVREVEKVRALSAGLLRGQEEERRRIARELHDGLNQRLAALSMELGAVEGLLTEPEEARERLQSIGERVESLSDEVRRISHQLHPSILEHAGFVAALRSHCNEFTQQTHIESHFDAHDVPEPIDRVIATALFRLSQEALQNVAKHSEASRIQIEVSGHEQGIRLSIHDNGKGFDQEAPGSREGLGLLSMKERARSLGGWLLVESSPQKGVKLDVWVPTNIDLSTGRLPLHTESSAATEAAGPPP